MVNLENPCPASIGLLYNSSVTDKNEFKTYIGSSKVKILSDKLIVYNENSGNSGGKNRNEKSLANLLKKRTKNTISKATKSKIKNILDNWLSAIALHNKKCINNFERRFYNPVFITLTLSAKQIHSDEFINKNMLMRFLEKYKYHTESTHIFWRAESQENGNIHYHIIGDRYINWKLVRELWNDTQEKFGYISAFEKIHHHRNPNSTDVKGVKSVKNFIRYCTKYVGKEDKYRVLKCRLWGMTDNLRRVTSFSIVVTTQIESTIQMIENQKTSKTLKSKYVKVICINDKYMSIVEKLDLYNQYKKHLIDLYDFLYLGKKLTKFKDDLLTALDLDTGEIIEVSVLELSDRIVLYNV